MPDDVRLSPPLRRCHQVCLSVDCSVTDLAPKESERARAAVLEHFPEKWAPVFR
jgi:hypothetical protein